MKFLKNYTSDVPVSQTIYRIEQVLIRCGVTAIGKEYSPKAGEVAAITFKIPMPENGAMQVRLPADVHAATDALWEDYVDGDKLAPGGQKLDWNNRKKKSRTDFVAQGERTAWKIVQDWVEVQMSMIATRQAETIQVFLPYVWDGKRTFYEAIKADGYRGLLPEKCSS